MSDIVTLNGYKIKDEKAVRSYETIALMKADTKLKEGYHVKTKGYYEANDGGHGEYVIVDDETLVDDGGSIHTLNNGLRAKLIFNDVINVDQFGAKGDGVSDDYEAISTALSKCKHISLSSDKTYYTSDTIILTYRNIIDGNNGKIVGDSESTYPLLKVDGRTSPAYRTKVMINDLFIDGNSTHDGILFEYSADFFVRNVNVDHVRYGFYFKNSLIFKFENCLVQRADVALYNDDTSYSVCNNIEFDKCVFVSNRCVMDSLGFAFKNALFLNCEIEANNNTTGDAVMIIPASQDGTGGSSLIFEGCWFEANVPRDILSATNQSTPISVTNSYITHPQNTAYSFAKGTNEEFTIILDRCQDRSQYITGNNGKTIESTSPYVVEMNCYSRFGPNAMGNITGIVNNFGLLNRISIGEINLLQNGSNKTGQIKASSDWFNISANDTNGVRFPDANYLHPINIGGQAYLWTYSNHLYCKVGSAPETYNDGTILL